jgi:hypothetical protein
MSDFSYERLIDEYGKPDGYGVRHRKEPEIRLGFVWKVGDRWEAMLGSTGERSEPAFSTRETAAQWLFGHWSVIDGPAAKHIPDDPYEGLPGA